MKKTLLLLSFALLNAQNISSLFDKIKNTPEYKLDNLMVKEMKTNKKSIVSSLYPKITLTGSAEHFSIPNSLRPLPPTESTAIMMSGGSLPFSQNIYRLGFNITMPVFIKEIYDNKKRMDFLLNAVKYQAKLNLLKKQSALIIYVSNLNYLFALKDALIKQKESIKTTYNALKVGVDVGRIPEFKLMRLKDSLIALDNKISQLNTKIADTEAKIYTLTSVYLKKPLSISSSNVNKGDFFALKPLKEQLSASKYEIKAKKDASLPKVSLKIQGSKAYAKAYNTDENIADNFASAGVYISWDIFNKKNGSEIQKARLSQQKTALEIQKTIKDLTSQINNINKSLQEINKQLLLTKDSIGLKEELLKGAKVAFKLDRMSVDEYLKYEDALANEKANLANLIALKNSLISQKALIYGKNLKKVFK